VITASELLARLDAIGVSEISGVPCSYLTPLINRTISSPATRYVPASQEGEAVSIAAGAWLGGGLGCAFTQNSGLGNMVGPIVSLMHPARIPALLVVTWRGRPGEQDEPQHTLMGAITTELLELMEVGHDLLHPDPALLSPAFATAERYLETESLPYAFVLAGGTLAEEALSEPDLVRGQPLVERHEQRSPRPSRASALERMLETVPERAVLIATTGWTSRELYGFADRPQHFYLVGAMGSAATVGLGVALHTDRPVVVVDGDGALMMRLGSLGTVAAAAPPNLVHVVLDNGVHDSTGGQRSVAAHVDLPAVAAACGYEEVHACGGLDDFGDALANGLSGRGPAFLHLPVRPGAGSALGRPSIGPADVARRFRDFVTAEEPAARSAELVEVS